MAKSMICQLTFIAESEICQLKCHLDISTEK